MGWAGLARGSMGWSPTYFYDGHGGPTQTQGTYGAVVPDEGVKLVTGQTCMGTQTGFQFALIILKIITLWNGAEDLSITNVVKDILEISKSFDIKFSFVSRNFNRAGLVGLMSCTQCIWLLFWL